MNTSPMGRAIAVIAGILLLAGFLVLAAIGSGVFRAPMSEPAANSNTNVSVNANTNTGTGAVVPERMTISGVHTCLPHKDTSGPQTLECAVGLRATDGKYYGLDLSGLSAEDNNYVMSGSGVTLSGLVTPTVMLSSDRWQKYQMEGIMKVGTISK